MWSGQLEQLVFSPLNPSCASRIFQSIPVQPPETAVSIWKGEPSGKPRLSSLSCTPKENLSFHSKTALNHYEMYSVMCYPLLLTFYFISVPKNSIHTHGGHVHLSLVFFSECYIINNGNKHGFKSKDSKEV